jgi:hypothetical protein
MRYSEGLFDNRFPNREANVIETDPVRRIKGIDLTASNKVLLFLLGGRIEANSTSVHPS